MVEHKETCLKVNGKQIAKLRSGSIKFKNYFKQLAAPFKIYLDFECNLEKIYTNEKGNDTLYTKKYQDHIACSFAYKVVCVDDNFNKPVVLYRGENAVCKFMKQFLKSVIIAKKWWMNIWIKIFSCL